LRQLLFGGAGFAAQQDGVLDPIFPDERLQARRIGKLLGFFEIQSDDLQPPIAILLVDRREELILVMAVRGTNCP